MNITTWIVKFRLIICVCVYIVLGELTGKVLFP